MNCQANIPSQQALLHMLHLASPALPVGAYAYSQGLEYAIDSGQLKNTDDIQAWLKGILHFGLAQLDLPILIRCHSAWKKLQFDQANYWNNYLRASRETSELLLEDEQLGIALKRLLIDLDLPEKPLEALQQKPCFAVMFSYAAQHWLIPLNDTLNSFSYSWLENQVAAATKIVPLGQTAAQKLLLKLLPEILQAISQAYTISDEEIGISLPGQIMASSLHEYQYSRLFRS